MWAGVGVLVSGLSVLDCALVVADGVYPTVGAEDQQQYETWVVLGSAAGCAVPAVAVVAWVLAVARRGAQGKLTAYPRPRFLVGVAVLRTGLRFPDTLHDADTLVVPETLAEREPLAEVRDIQW